MADDDNQMDEGVVQIGHPDAQANGRKTAASNSGIISPYHFMPRLPDGSNGLWSFEAPSEKNPFEDPAAPDTKAPLESKPAPDAQAQARPGMLLEEMQTQEADKAHSKPTLQESMYPSDGTAASPEGGIPSAQAVRKFVTIVNTKGLAKLLDDGHIDKHQYKAISHMGDVDNDTRYLIALEGPDAGHLEATRAFSGKLETMIVVEPKPANSPEQISAAAGQREELYLDVTKTLNLSVKKAIPQHAEHGIPVEGENFLPSKVDTQTFLDDVEKADYAKNEKHSPAMQQALALANDPQHQPQKGYDQASSGGVPNVLQRDPSLKI